MKQVSNLGEAGSDFESKCVKLAGSNCCDVSFTRAHVGPVSWKPGNKPNLEYNNFLQNNLKDLREGFPIWELSKSWHCQKGGGA